MKSEVDSIAQNKFLGYTDEELADWLLTTKNLIAIFQEQQNCTEQELIRRLQGRDAMELAHPTLEVKLVFPSPVYETAKLMALAELVPPEEYTKAYQPEWVKEIVQAARFDGRVLNTLARKFGAPVTALLARAELPSSPRLVVKTKETAPAQ